MNKDLHNIDDLFRKALGENQELPSASVWDNIDKTLDKKKVVSISKKYNKLKWVAAVLLLFSLGMAMYTLHIRKQNSDLVKQNKEGKNILKQKSQTKISGVDSSISNTANANPSVDANSPNKNFQKQIHNADTEVANNKITITDNKTLSNKKDAREKEVVADKNNNIISSSLKAGESTALLRRKKQTVKNAADVKMNMEAGTIDSASPNDKKNEQSATSDRKNNIDKTQVTNNTSRNIITDTQKNIETTGLAPELKNDFLLPIQNPAYQNNNKLSSRDMVFSRNASFSKRNKINSGGSSLLSATVFFSPDIVSTELKDDHPRFREEERNAIEKDEQIKFSSTFGVLVDYNIGKNWKLESGVTYSSRKTDIQPKTIYARPDNDGNVNFRFNCSAGYSYVTVKSSLPPASGDSVSTLASKNNLQYIGLPLYAKYIFRTGRFSILPGAGVSFNFLTKGQIETTIASTSGSKIPSTDKIQGLKSMYVNGAAGIGLQYKLNKAFSLSFEPAFRFAISSINKDASVKTNLNSIGLSTGIVFKL